MAWLYFWPCLSCRGVEPTELSEIAENRYVFRVLPCLLSRDPPQMKNGCETRMNEYIIYLCENHGGQTIVTMFMCTEAIKMPGNNFVSKFSWKQQKELTFYFMVVWSILHNSGWALHWIFGLFSLRFILVLDTRILIKRNRQAINHWWTLKPQ